MAREQVCSPTQELSAANLQVEVISDPIRFSAMRSEWDSLIQRAGIEHPFLSHTWLLTWWESFGAGKRLYVITARLEGELVAAAPMQCVSQRLYGIKVDTLGAMYNPHTPRYDFIIATPERAPVYEAIWRTASAHSGCDVVVLNQIPDTSPTLAAIRKLAEGEGWRAGEWASPPSPYIRLGCDFEQFVARLTGGHRCDLRKRYDRLRKVGSISVEVITEKQDVRSAMEDGLRIEAAAWKGDEGTAIISDPAVRDFYIRLAEREADRGRLRLSFLRLDDKRISFSYILRSQEALYCVKIGYDPAYHGYSPGNMLLHLTLQDACADGVQEYDFLGIDDEWKFDWTKDTRNHRWLFLFRKNVRARLLHYLKFTIAPKVKPRIAKISA